MKQGFLNRESGYFFQELHDPEIEKEPDHDHASADEKAGCKSGGIVTF